MQTLLFLAYLGLSFVSCLQAEIIETNRFADVAEYQQDGTLILLDIDDTLLLPAQTLGTDVWYLSRLRQYKNLYQDSFLALEKALADWEAIRHLTRVKLVEVGTDAIVLQMQSNNALVMGLTTQGLALATRTVLQLKSLNIDLSKTAPASEDYYFMNGNHGVLYRQGILFTSGTAKGEALLKLLDMIDFHPKHIVFINDKKTHLQDVEATALANGIAFTGLRYSYGDARVASYSQEIADIQWQHSTFDHILSDEEACSFLEN